MFEIGFWELVLIGIIALVVLGPERLPQAARTLGLWAGRARSYVRHFSAELEREVQAQDVLQQARRQISEVEQMVQGQDAGHTPPAMPPPAVPPDNSSRE